MQSTPWIAELSLSVTRELDEEFEFQYSEAWAVYADLLQEEGSPLGHNIANAQGAYLQCQEEPIAATEFPTVHGVHRYGFFRTIDFDYSARLRENLELFLRSEASRFVSQATFYVLDDVDGFLQTLTKLQQHSCLTELTIDLCQGDTIASERLLATALQIAPGLRSLSLFGDNIATGITIDFVEIGAAPTPPFLSALTQAIETQIQSEPAQPSESPLPIRVEHLNALGLVTRIAYTEYLTISMGIHRQCERTTIGLPCSALAYLHSRFAMSHPEDGKIIKLLMEGNPTHVRTLVFPLQRARDNYPWLFRRYYSAFYFALSECQYHDHQASPDDYMDYCDGSVTVES